MIQEGIICAVYQVYISDPEKNEPLFSVQSIKDGKEVSIYRLYGEEVSEQQLIDFFIKNKPK